MRACRKKKRNLPAGLRILMRNKVVITILILGMVFCAIRIANAVPAAPSPTCEIIAKVIKIEKTKIVTPPILQLSDEIEYYRVKLQILEISTYQKEGSRSCDDSYIKTAEEAGQILTLKEYDKNPISQGQKIKAKIHFSGDERFHGYFLSDIKITKE